MLFRRFHFLSGFFLLVSELSYGVADDLSLDTLWEMSLEELTRVRIQSSSYFEQSQMNSANSVSITHRQRWQEVAARNVGELLNTLPSTVAAPGFGQSRIVAIRGYFATGSARGTAVRFDGVPMNKLREGTGLMDLDGYDLDSLESIELIRGPGSALHGNDAFHGVLSLNSAAPQSTQSRTTLAAGSLEERSASLLHHHQGGVHAITAGLNYRDLPDEKQNYRYLDNNSNTLSTSQRRFQRLNQNLLLKYRYNHDDGRYFYANSYWLDFDAQAAARRRQRLRLSTTTS